MELKKILVVVGTRPNFIKITRFREVAALYPHLEVKIVHTGQHYDDKMADIFFRQFGLTPDFFLNVPQGDPVQQIADVIQGMAKLIAGYRPDLVVVVGDVNSTMAAAIAANKMSVKLAHVESGLRSFDKSMPEEHNRIVTDDLSDLFFVTEPSGLENLKQEGKSPATVFYTGNTMIDTMVKCADQIESSLILQELKLQPRNYFLTTIHRPSNVDNPEGLKLVVELISKLSDKKTVVFPVHPRTRRTLESNDLFKVLQANGKVILTEPLGYFDFQKLVKDCACVITDSGGIQEETTFLGIPCLTLRPNTERPVTVEVGSNTLLPFEIGSVIGYVDSVIAGNYKRGSVPELWDGRATERIFEAIVRYLE